jgi:tetratricopeptide (TPR) repeat protein
MMCCLRVLTGVLIFALLPPAGAASSDDSWQQAVRAFGDNDYESALVNFESARDAGQGGPAVHYNIGVSQYKLGRYRDAGITFELIAIQYPRMQALAEYNLGLVALKLDRNDDARQHFRRSYDLSTNDENLHSLSATMLATMEPTAEVDSGWFGAVGMSAGYDDNVILRDDLGLPLGTTAESPMADIYGSFGIPFADSGRFRFHGDLYAARYFEIDDFDQNAIRVGVLYNHRFGQWRAQGGVHAGYGTLGGDGFDQTSSLSIRLDRRISQSSSVGIRYRYDDISAADSIYSGIEGSRQRIDALYRWYSGDRSLLVNFQFESNDRTDPGVSPTRSRLGIDYRFKPLSGWGYEAGADFRGSDYDDLDPQRTEDLIALRVGVSRTLGQSWRMLAEYYHSDNDSNDSTFSFDRNRVTLTLMRTF